MGPGRAGPCSGSGGAQVWVTRRDSTLDIRPIGTSGDASGYPDGLAADDAQPTPGAPRCSRRRSRPRPRGVAACDAPAVAARCEGAPGLSAVQQYCESIPSAGGDRSTLPGNTSGSGTTGSNPFGVLPRVCGRRCSGSFATRASPAVSSRRGWPQAAAAAATAPVGWSSPASRTKPAPRRLRRRREPVRPVAGMLGALAAAGLVLVGVALVASGVRRRGPRADADGPPAATSSCLTAGSQHRASRPGRGGADEAALSPSGWAAGGRLLRHRRGPDHGPPQLRAPARPLVSRRLRVVRIGHFVAIADDVVDHIGGTHPTHWVSTFPFRTRFRQPGAYRDGLPAAARDIVVGSDVWIGRGARILPGVRIGDGAVVGAYAVVGNEVRPYAIVVGNPAARCGDASPTSRSSASCASAGGTGPTSRSCTRPSCSTRMPSTSSSIATTASRRRPSASDKVRPPRSPGRTNLETDAPGAAPARDQGARLLARRHPEQPLPRADRPRAAHLTPREVRRLRASRRSASAPARAREAPTVVLRPPRGPRRLGAGRGLPAALLRAPAGRRAPLRRPRRALRVVDLGAHVGLFGLWVIQRLPAARSSPSSPTRATSGR